MGMWTEEAGMTDIMVAEAAGQTWGEMGGGG